LLYNSAKERGGAGGAAPWGTAAAAAPTCGCGGTKGATGGAGGMFMVLSYFLRTREGLLRGYALANSRITNNERYALVAGNERGRGIVYFVG